MRTTKAAVAWGLVLFLALTARPAIAAGAKIQPGQWRTTETVIEMTNPLLPPEVVARRKAKPAVVDYCVRSDSLEELLVGKDARGLCKGEVKIENGRIAVDRTCGSGSRKIEGTYTAVKIETLRESRMQTPQGELHSKLRVVSERVGECTP